MFYKVPVNDGMLDINYEDLLEAVQLSKVEAYVRLNDDAVVRQTWLEITDVEYNQVKPVIPEPVLGPNLEDKVNYLYYKSMGVIV